MSEIPEDIRKTAAWVAAHRHDLRKPDGVQMAQLIGEAIFEERKRIAFWLESQRRDVPAHGWEFAAAVRSGSIVEPWQPPESESGS